MILAKPTSTIRNYIFISLIAVLLQGCFLFGGGGGSGESATSEGQVEKALERFRDGKEEGLNTLIQTFQDPEVNTDVRTAAAVALSRANHPEANLALIKGLGELSELNIEFYVSIANALGETGDPNAVNALKEGLAGSRKRYAVLRDALLRAMANTSDIASIEALMDALQSSKEDLYLVSKTVSETLGSLGDDRVVPALMSIAKDADTDIAIRSRAIEILGKKKDPNLVPFLLEMMNDPRSQAQVRDFALNAVADIKDAQVILLLLEAFQQGRQEYQSLTNALTKALGEVGDVRAAPTLVKIARDKDLSPLVRRNAIENLRKINNPNVVLDLIELMYDVDNYILFDEVYRTVKELGGEEAIKSLRAASASAQKDAVDNQKRKEITGF
ncbi:MAG: HEAT repeat domain-containing protein [Candidatus Marinimicrobia bacterium]|nr:HEAT repeat domain-containing protein [Candidatus Neomarinimicrobiota bacterium]